MASGGIHALALLLLVAAAAKLRRPLPAVVALHQAGLPASSLLVRLLSLGEIALAAAVLMAGGAGPALALAALHLGFAAFLVRLRARAGEGASCGCFGADAPADRLHVAANLAGAGVAVLAAATGPRSLLSTLGAQPALGLPYLVLVALAAQAMLLVLTGLPRLLAAQRRLA
jgi:hypothetical protein